MLLGKESAGDDLKARPAVSRGATVQGRNAKLPSRFGRRRRVPLGTSGHAVVLDHDAPAFSILPVHALRDIAVRRPVWEALSSLFLNTDPSHTPVSRAALLAASPYSIQELEQILIYEVYPVCTYNMLSVAGAWAGFSIEWLEARIVERLRSRWRFLRGLNVGRITVPLFGKWQKTKRAISLARHQAPGALPAI